MCPGWRFVRPVRCVDGEDPRPCAGAVSSLSFSPSGPSFTAVSRGREWDFGRKVRDKLWRKQQGIDRRCQRLSSRRLLVLCPDKARRTRTEQARTLV